MKHLRQFCTVMILLCAFSFSAHAGNIPCDVVPPPPEEATLASDIQNSVESSGTITDTLLILIEGVLLVS